MRRKNRFTPYMGYAVAVVVLVATVSAIANAVVPNTFNIQEAVMNFGSSEDDEALGSGIATADGTTNFTTNVAMERNLDLQATTTLQELKWGTRFSEALDFTRGNTTTPGALFSLQNTGAAKLCTLVEVEITTGSTAGGPAGAGNAFTFAVGTSTAASSWSTKTATVIASTTPATSSLAIINSLVSPGSYVGTDQDIGGAPWLWGNGEYLLGVFDDASKSTGGGTYATDSGSYTGMAGSVYVSCHTR